MGRAGVPRIGAGAAGRPAGASLAVDLLCQVAAPVPVPQDERSGRLAAESGTGVDDTLRAVTSQKAGDQSMIGAWRLNEEAFT